MDQTGKGTLITGKKKAFFPLKIFALDGSSGKSTGYGVSGLIRALRFLHSIFALNGKE
jgi:hypothetical protein